MAHPSRRMPSPNPSRYYAIPQSPQQHSDYPYGQHQLRHTSRSNRTRPADDLPAAVAPIPPRKDLAQGVATGAIGAGYGPYSHSPTANRTRLANDRPAAVAPILPRKDLAQGVGTGAIGAGYGPYAHPPTANRTRLANDRPAAVAPIPPRKDLAQGVATGAIGAGYGPYAHPPTANRTRLANDRPAAVAPIPPRKDLAQSVATGATGAGYGPYGLRPAPATAATGNQHASSHVYSTSRFSISPSEQSSVTGERRQRPMPPANTSTVPAYMWDTKDLDLDDALDNPDPRVESAQDTFLGDESYIGRSSSSLDTIAPINHENPQLHPYPSSITLQSNGSVYNASFMTSPSYDSLI